MTIRVDLFKLQPHIAGQGCLSVKKWQGGHECLEFSIQRNQDGHFLQGDQHWSNSPYWFKVAHFSVGATEEELETVVGPQLIDPVLEGGANAQFMIELREQGGGGYSDRGVLKPAVGLQPSSANTEEKLPEHKDTGELPPPPAPAQPEPAPVVEPEPVVEPVTPQPDPEPAPAPPAPPPAAPRKKAWLLPLIIALVVLAAIAVGAWFWLNKTPAAQAPAPEPAPAPAPAITGAEACTLESMSTLPELTFVQTCIKKAPGSAELLEIINVAKANNHCGVAQRLYANRAQAGDLPIAMAYAHEYDPKFHQASTCFAEPDKATATYWYETILSQDPDNADAKARFEELKP